MHDLINHLWQSTAFALAIALLTLLLRKNRARTRYWLWLAASIKFLAPFSLLVDAGAQIDAPARLSPRMPALTVDRMSTSFAPMPLLPSKPVAPGLPRWPAMLEAIWLVGALVLLIRWTLRWRAIQSIRNSSTALPIRAPIAVASAPTTMEPGVIGVFRPTLVLPQGILENLTAEQMDAIVAHELCHVRYRDNLTAAFHMIVETLFWFHPLVWWIGTQLVAERERACDEAVLEQGSHPQTYAEGILNVCKFYVESRLKCAAGVTGGADLKRRITQIMTHPLSLELTAARKFALATAGVAAVALPFALGVLRAQTLPPPPKYTYEVVSVKPAEAKDNNSRLMPGPQGGMRGENVAVAMLLNFAYNTGSYQFVGGPDWVKTARWDLSYTPDTAETTPTPGVERAVMESFIERQRQRMQTVLRDRFGLVLRAEIKQLPMYSLVQAKGGHKLKVAAAGGPPMMRFSRGSLSGKSAFMTMLCSSLGNSLDRYIANDTGLDGAYDFELTWAPDPNAGPPAKPSEGASAGAPAAAGGEGPTLFTALTEQLGLRLESKKGPVPVFVIEKIEKPSGN